MATIFLNHYTEIDLSTLNTKISQVSQQMEFFNQELLALDNQTVQVFDVSSSSVYGNWGGYTLNATGSNFLSGNVAAMSISSISLSNPIQKMVFKGNINLASGGTVTSFSYSSNAFQGESGNKVLASFGGVFKLNSELDFVSATIKTAKLVRDDYTVTFSGKVNFDDQTDSITGGTVNSFGFIGPSGHALKVSGISMSFDSLDSLTDTELDHTNLIDLFNSIDLTGNDSITSTDSDDFLLGYAGKDTLSSGAGSDTLDGGSGVDVLAGGLGNDTYYVDLLAKSSVKHGLQDKVIEAANGGTDTLILRGSVTGLKTYTLEKNVENLDISAINSSDGFGIFLVGNGLSNQVTGDALANDIKGGAGNDTLIGGAGEDTLDGGVGQNSLIGGEGSDTYFIRNASDVIVEDAESVGADILFAYTSINLDLFSNIEYARIAFGVQNVIITSSTGNIYSGSNGKDNITATSGNDIFQHSSGNDIFIGGAGNDTFYSGYNKDNDTLTGGAGEDRFIFETVVKFNGLDTITDFEVGLDKIHLSRAVFESLSDGLNEDMLVFGNKALDANDFLIYDQSASTLSYDADGSGSGKAIKFAILTGVSELSITDFVIA